MFKSQTGRISISLVLGLLGIFLLNVACSDATATPKSAHADAPSISHQGWTALLAQYVDADGMVNYQGFQNDEAKLQQYLDLLSANPPAANWSEAEKIAYWINAYNAFTVKVIADNYPLESIRDLHTIPGIKTIWHKEFFKIGGQPASLNQIEHEILRKEFVEPRIHVAINCASMSCPVLLNEAYTADKLDTQLTAQMEAFLRQPIRNKITKDAVQLSKIFKWFAGDFTRNGSIIDFLNQYAPVQINPEAEVDYLDYDWSLNETKNKG
ncbi:MAG: DUF547 domain-containing protein [Bacteroidota bacterium]